MRVFCIILTLGWGVGLLPAGTPSFQEIYGLLRTNVTGLDAGALDQAATRGLMQQLAGKVTLVEATEGAPTLAAAVTRTRLYENEFGYVRVGAVNRALPDAFAQAVATLTSTNRLKGLVIDLRFAGGTDYSSATAVVAQLLARPEPIMDYGEGLKKGETNPDALHVPVAVLINGGTTAAAEALAAALREVGRALTLGDRSAGRAYVIRDHPLSTGQTLRLAVRPVKVGRGVEMSEEGVVPDLRVEVKPMDETLYFEDPYAASQADRQNQSTNRSSRRLTEADLVRMLRESQEPDLAVETSPETEPAPKVVRDPVLARALDVLKGLAVVHQSNSTISR